MTGYSSYLGAGLPDWDAEADDILVCRQIRAETADVKSFTFSARTPRRFHFKPGQFLTLSLEIGGATVERCYTIASSPTRPCLVTITVKRVAGGLVSNWLHDQLRPGMELRALGPLGEFTAFDRPAGKFLFLAAGSGITPLMSMARRLASASSTCSSTTRPCSTWRRCSTPTLQCTSGCSRST